MRPIDVTPNPRPDTQIVPHPSNHTQVGGVGSDSDLEKALALSLQDSKRQKRQETSNVLDLQLDDQTLPRGLKNLGNTCFVNCLMQVYFYLTPIRDQILKIENLDNNIVIQLQELFANLLYTEKRYYDPRALLDILAKDKILENVGVQEDINEVNGKLLTKLEEADEGLKEFLQKHFYGQFMTTITSAEEDNTPIELHRGQPFNHLHVNISNENPSLYQSLNDLTASEKHEFTTDKGFKTTAERIMFIKNAPPVILFQLKRSQFSKAVGMTIKINKAYEFPDYIYLDRYLHENRDEILKRRGQVNRFKHEIRVLRDQLKNFEYGGKDGPTLLADTLKFLKKIGRGEGGVEEGLSKIHDEVKNHSNVLKEDVKNYEKKIDSVFLDWKKEKYVLYAIVVHEGTSVDMGHYVTYIKYNDHPVHVEESEGEGEEEKVSEIKQEKNEEELKKEKIENETEKKNETEKEEEEKVEEEPKKEEEEKIEKIELKESPAKSKDRFNWCKFNDKNVDLMTEESVYENLKIGNRSVYCILSRLPNDLQHRLLQEKTKILSMDVRPKIPHKRISTFQIH